VIKILRLAILLGFLLQLFGCVPYRSRHAFNQRRLVKIQRSVPKVTDQLPRGRWLLINGTHRTLSVMDGSSPIKVFYEISFGGGGVGYKSRKGDMITPVGRYAIGWVNRESKFELFFGITYPNGKDAERGLSRGVISRDEARYLQVLEKMQHTPPQNTNLGGMIGIHGIGMGNADLHRVLNWTDGCIALDNDQIYELSSWISLGMVVEIKP
jgi:murein L,D-transpeptidase YafK